jgi:GNAT superfamily N-acetyltransferase
VWEENGAHGGASYRDGQYRVVKALLDRAVVRVEEDAEGLVKGWLCFEPGDIPLVHYVYVRKMYRGQGVMRRLLGELAHTPCVYTHRARGLNGRKLPVGWQFNKVLAFLPREAA